MNLIHQIEQDLSSHISTGELPCKMTVASLAEYYNVSSTPIRGVITNLIQSGKVTKHPNGRLEPNFSTKSSKQPKTIEQPITKDPYEQILRDIVHKSLDKGESFIREENTASTYNLSRSAVREQFIRIAGEGLLEHLPRRGWRVRSFTQQDLIHYSEAREAMELKALDSAWGKLLDIDLQSMLDGNQPAKHDHEMPIIDNRLHYYILEKSENYYIQDFFKRHSTFFRIIFEWEGENRQAAVDAVQQHHDILNALLNRDKKTAMKALSHHIHHNHPVLKKLHRNS